MKKKVSLALNLFKQVAKRVDLPVGNNLTLLWKCPIIMIDRFVFFG